MCQKKIKNLSMLYNSPYKQVYKRREPQLQKKSKIEAHENPNSCGFFKALMCNDQNVSHVPNTETTSPQRIPELDLSRGLALAPVSTSQAFGNKENTIPKLIF